MNIFFWNRHIYRVPTHTEKQLCKSLVAQTSWPLSSEGENIIPISLVLVFLSLDYSLMGSWQTFPEGCKHITLEQFSLFKMAARMSEFLVNHIYSCCAPMNIEIWWIFPNIHFWGQGIQIHHLCESRCPSYFESSMRWMPECQNFLFNPYLSHLELEDIQNSKSYG